MADWACGICNDADVPEKFRVFGNCYKCATRKSIYKRDRKIHRLMREVARLRVSKEEDTVIEYNGELFRADPDCKHEVYAKMAGGVKCRKCPGWFCY